MQNEKQLKYWRDAYQYRCGAGFYVLVLQSQLAQVNESHSLKSFRRFIDYDIFIFRNTHLDDIFTQAVQRDDLSILKSNKTHLKRTTCDSSWIIDNFKSKILDK